MTQLTLGTPDHAAALHALMAQFAADRGHDGPSEAREAALAPLLEGSPYGMAYLLGPVRAPVGYLVVTLCWSLDLGGLEARVDEIYVRAPVRGRGLATEALLSLARGLAEAGVRALRLELAGEEATGLCRRAGFAPQERARPMVRPL